MFLKAQWSDLTGLLCADGQFPEHHQESGLFYLRVLRSQSLRQRQRSFGVVLDGAVFEVQIGVDPESAVEVGVVPVGAEVMAQKQKNKQRTRHAHRQASGVQQRVTVLQTQVPPGDSEVVPEHGLILRYL